MVVEESENEPYLRRLRQRAIEFALDREQRVDLGFRLLREAITGKPADAGD